jgi:transposase
VKESAGKSRSGHINRESRKLTRTILTQSIHHVSNSSPYLKMFYCELTEKRGCGRARVALIRKVCSIMRRMLLTGEEFRWIEHQLFERKLKEYEKVLAEIREERKSA